MTYISKQAHQKIGYIYIYVILLDAQQYHNVIGHANNTSFLNKITNFNTSKYVSWRLTERWERQEKQKFSLSTSSHNGY